MAHRSSGKQEAAAAARVLGAAWRENLGWPDGGIAASPEMIRSAVDLIRQARPRAVAIPYWEDRHPDHGSASRVLREAIFKSGLQSLRNRSGAVATRVDLPLFHQRRRHAVVCG